MESTIESKMKDLRIEMMELEIRTGELEANNILLQMKLRIERKQRKEVEEKMKEEKDMLLISLHKSTIMQNKLLDYQNDPSSKSSFLIKHLTTEITNLKLVNEKLNVKYSRGVAEREQSKSITEAMRKSVENLR